MKKNKLVLFSLVIILAVSTVVATIGSVTGGVEMTSLDKKEAILIQEKKDLEENIVRSNSTTDLANESSNYGFSKVSDILYLTKTDAVAKLP